jgi:hypothetical protein
MLVLSASPPTLPVKVPTHLERLGTKAPDRISNSSVETIKQPLFQGVLQKTESIASEAIHKAPQFRYGRIENNIREVTRIALVHGLPLALAPLSFSGIPGLLLAFALTPVLLFSGWLGRRIGRHVSREQLTGGLKLFHRIRELFDPKLSEIEKNRLKAEMEKATTPEERAKILKKFSHRNHVEKINNAFRDFASGARLPGLLSFIRNEKYRSWLLKTLKVNEEKRFGRFLNDFLNAKTLSKNAMYTNIAQSESLMSALGAGVRGTRDMVVDFEVMPRVGKYVSQVGDSKLLPGFMKPLVQGAGLGLKNWFVTKSAWDAAMAMRKTSKT